MSEKDEYKNWESVIGLEIHVQLSTKSKIFSNSPTKFGIEQNSQASIIDLGLPGVLPVLNKKAIEMAVKFGCSINAEIANTAIFARKNYFYPDLPKGYQISQLDDPIVGQGSVEIECDEEKKLIGITRAHLEEDAGKSIHDKYDSSSAIDLNRAGTPLLEIVSEPDLRSAKEAVAYLKKIHSIVTFLDISDGNMSQGSMRCDANVSIRKKGETEYGFRTEIKNINSFKFVEKAINFEISRQIKIKETNNEIEQETRLYDSQKNETRSMRSKEHANDYRYFPEPDLIPLQISNEYIENIRKSLPELPEQKISRFCSEYGLSIYESEILNSSKGMSNFFEKVAISVKDVKTAAKWILGDFSAILNKNNCLIEDSLISSSDLIDLLNCLNENKISDPAAKKVLEILWNADLKVKEIIEKENLKQISNEDDISRIISEVISKNPKQLEQFKKGKEKLFGFFVGQVMKTTQGSADPKVVNKILKEKLSQ
ncbi:MAG: Asp-tRNA(Asn)/Glu-tRNA(Gln) amidotransferase subunit GatB [Gammaproteobacteria bacterium]